MASSSTTATTDADLDKLLNQEATALQRELEVERILTAFKLNPYDIFDLEADVTPEGIKKKYRQLSLFIHPDKCPHPKATEAFDILKKAESDLSDKDKRENLDAVINQARTVLLKSLSLPSSTSNNDAKLQGLKPPFRAQLLKASRDLLIDEEVRRRKAMKLTLANEGREAQQAEEEVLKRKRKAEDDVKWEENRDSRVDSWRSFAGTNKKKKKTKAQLLG